MHAHHRRQEIGYDKFRSRRVVTSTYICRSVIGVIWRLLYIVIYIEKRLRRLVCDNG